MRCIHLIHSSLLRQRHTDNENDKSNNNNNSNDAYIVIEDKPNVERLVTTQTLQYNTLWYSIFIYTSENVVVSLRITK